MSACAPTIDEAVFLNRDNAISLVLYHDGAALADLSAVTRVVLDLDGGTTVIDSDTAPGGTITWTAQRLHRGALVDVLRLVLGGESIMPGFYGRDHTTDPPTGEPVVIVVYDATYPDGLRVENDIGLTVHA